MKKSLSLLLLLLTLALAFSACTTSPHATDPTESNSESSSESDSESSSETEEEKIPQEINGIWYSHAAQTVLDLTDLSNVTYYLLMVGFYEYQEKTTLPATLENNVLTLTLDEETTLSLTFDPMEDTLTDTGNEDEISYTRKNAIPTQYVSLPFPNFATMGAKNLVQLGAYTDLKLPTTAEDFADAADAFTSIYGSLTTLNAPMVTDRPAQMNDYVNVDYTGYLDGEAFENGAATGADILISTNSGYIPGFAEGIVGHTVGETFDVTVTFPADYHEPSMAGKETVFTMTLHAIYDVRGAYLWKQVSDKTTIESYPEESYAYFLQYYHEMYHWYAYYYGMDYEVFLMMYGITETAMVEAAKISAANYLSVYAAVETFGIDVTEDAEALMVAMANKMATENGMTYEEAYQWVQVNNSGQMHAQAASTAVLKWLLQNHTAN